MSEWNRFLIFAILVGVVLASGWKMRPLDAEYEIIEEDPCDLSQTEDCHEKKS